MPVRANIVGVYDDDGFLVALKHNDTGETIAGLRLTLPCPDGPLPMPGGTTDEITLATVAIPGGMIGPKGTVRVWALFSCANSANAKTVRIKFGAANIQALNLANLTVADTIGRVKARATNSQVYSTSSSLTGTASAGVVVISENTQSEVLVTITGQLAVAGESLTLQSMSVEVDPGF